MTELIGLFLAGWMEPPFPGARRHAWNEFVIEHYAPTLAACASEARVDNVIIGCRLLIDPSLDATIPFYPDVTLTDVPPEEHSKSTADR